MIGRALATIGSAKAAVPERPASGRSGLSSAGLLGGHSVSQLQGLQSMTAAGWLFAVVERISTAVATADWKLYRTSRTGEPVAIDDMANPLASLWLRPNLVDTQMLFAELTQMYLELTGNAYWLLVGRGTAPTELWPIRPDRMRPIADRRTWLAGWEYTINGEHIVLPREVVVHIRRPSPLDEFLGVSPVASIFTDVQSDRNAAGYNAMFFKNGAEPGGIIESPENLQPEEYEQFLMRWREQHQGTGNAFRVALLEGGMHWVDRKFTQRDMQFEQLRRLSRDVIFGAWGIHPSIMGVAEDVNRANAEAAEDHFAKWLIRPRLERIKDSLNQYVAPLFGDDYEFDFEDPVPENRDLKLREAELGSLHRVLTVNEVRARLGEDATGDPEDDELPEPPPAPTFGQPPSDAPDDDQDDDVKMLAKASDSDPRGVKPETVDQAEQRIAERWEQRLSDEVDGIVEHLSKMESKQILGRLFGVEVQKIDVGDVDSYDWDWLRRYGEEVASEIARAFELALLAELPTMGPERVQLYASEYARLRAGDLLADYGEYSLVPGTRDRVKSVVGDLIEQGRPLRELEAILRGDEKFSRHRATNVARTETATALGQGQRRAALELGRDQKMWVSQADAAVCPICQPNVSQGWIGINATFASGHDTVPSHPSCRCTVIYRTKDVHEDSFEGALVREAHCPNGHLIGKEVTPGIHYCWKCKANVMVDGESEPTVVESFAR